MFVLLERGAAVVVVSSDVAANDFKFGLDLDDRIDFRETAFKKHQGQTDSKLWSNKDSNNNSFLPFPLLDFFDSRPPFLSFANFLANDFACEAAAIALPSMFKGSNRTVPVQGTRTATDFGQIEDAE